MEMSEIWSLGLGACAQVDRDRSLRITSTKRSLSSIDWLQGPRRCSVAIVSATSTVSAGVGDARGLISGGISYTVDPTTQPN